ncbi:MAG TPA: ribosomal L7Ae/L30e/S12e/Gadd45 family protein [Firmicutes bacterium]|nr:ribosomal L7Ae/L30e/S12e/Gadd45 family protein [Bacillota bacterium]
MIKWKLTYGKGRFRKMDTGLPVLSLCRKAGLLSIGFDMTKQALAERKAVLVVLADGISPKTEKEICFWAKKYQVNVFRSAADIQEISAQIGKKAGVLGILNQGLAKSYLNKQPQAALLQANISSGK